MRGIEQAGAIVNQQTWGFIATGQGFSGEGFNGISGEGFNGIRAEEKLTAFK